MRVKFRLTRDARSLAGQLSPRAISVDARNAIAQFSEIVGGDVSVADVVDESHDATTVVLTAHRPEELPRLSEAWQRALVSHGVQSDAVA